MGSLFKSKPDPKLGEKFAGTLASFPALEQKLSAGLQPVDPMTSTRAAFELLAVRLWMDTFGQEYASGVVLESLGQCLESRGVPAEVRQAAQVAQPVKGPARKFPDASVATLFSHLAFRLNDMDSKVAEASRRRTPDMEPVAVLASGLQSSCQARWKQEPLEPEQSAVLARVLFELVYDTLYSR